MSDDLHDPNDVHHPPTGAPDASATERDDVVERLAVLARAAEPPKLSAAESDALVAAVLARRREPTRADSWPPGARDESLTAEERELALPDPLALPESASGGVGAVAGQVEPEVDARPDGSTAHHRPPHRSSSPPTSPRAAAAPRALWLAAAAVLLGGGALFLVRSAPAPLVANAEEPTRLVLPTGDTLVSTAGAQLAVVEASEGRRSVEVRAGTVLFDVAPLAPGDRFVVRARGVRAEVRGTVFSVDEGARVRVYEGAVAVAEGDSSVLVTAGRMWVDGELRARDRSPLDGEGEAAAARRMRSAARASNEQASNDQASNEQASNDLALLDSALLDSASLDSASLEQASQDQAARPSEPAELEAASDRVAPTSALTPSRSTTSRGARASSERVTPATLARWIVDGDAERARVEARRRGWRIVEADALRALHRFEEALAIYERLAPRDGYAAFTGARLAATELEDPSRALRALERAPSGAFDERVLGLRVRLLVEAGRRDEALPLAARYVDRFPSGTLAQWMRALPDAR